MCTKSLVPVPDLRFSLRKFYACEINNSLAGLVEAGGSEAKIEGANNA
jgi:hypothetical protein